MYRGYYNANFDPQNETLEDYLEVQADKIYVRDKSCHNTVANIYAEVSEKDLEVDKLLHTMVYGSDDEAKLARLRFAKKIDEALWQHAMKEATLEYEYTSGMDGEDAHFTQQQGRVEVYTRDIDMRSYKF